MGTLSNTIVQDWCCASTVFPYLPMLGRSNDINLESMECPSTGTCVSTPPAKERTPKCEGMQKKNERHVGADVLW